MRLLLHIVSHNNKEGVTHSLTPSNHLQIDIEDLDMLDFELELDVPITNSEGLKLLIGNTVFRFDEPTEVQGSFYYKIDINHIVDYLPGFKAHISKEFYKTLSGQRRFSRLFLNEIGLSKIYIVEGETEIYFGGVSIFSKKLSSDNYKVITEYLLYNDYFDSKFLYKVVIEGHQSNLPTSLLEALRRLVSKLRNWRNDLVKFRKDPILKLSEEARIKPYSPNERIGSETIDWLLDNAENFAPTNAQNSEVVLLAKNYFLKEILITEPKDIFDSYENRIIHGFILNLFKILADKESEANSFRLVKNKITSFKDYLLNCFNELLQRHFNEAKAELIVIKSYFTEFIPVKAPIYSFPKKVDGFHSKRHYSEVFKLINYAKNIFSVAFDKNEISLEIESFDKLFEVYCFYLLKDVISLNFSKNHFVKMNNGFFDEDNDLAGEYVITFEKLNTVCRLYYEHLPIDIIQL